MEAVDVFPMGFWQTTDITFLHHIIDFEGKPTEIRPHSFIFRSININMKLGFSVGPKLN